MKFWICRCHMVSDLEIAQGSRWNRTKSSTSRCVCHRARSQGHRENGTHRYTKYQEVFVSLRDNLWAFAKTAFSIWFPKRTRFSSVFDILKIFNFMRDLWQKTIDSSHESRLCCDSLCPVLKGWRIQRGQHVWMQRCCPGYSSWRIFRILKVRKLRNQKSWEKFKETPVKA